MEKRMTWNRTKICDFPYLFIPFIFMIAPFFIIVSSSMQNNRNDLIKVEEFPVQLSMNKGAEKLAVVNMPTETNPHFGKVKLNANVET